jgi:ribosomal protein L37AE/L43A
MSCPHLSRVLAEAPSAPVGQEMCESCGARADVRLADGSTWCDECNEAAHSLGYDDAIGVPLSGSEVS